MSGTVEAVLLRHDEIPPELLQMLQKLLRILENAPEMYAQIDPRAPSGSYDGQRVVDTLQSKTLTPALKSAIC